MKERKIHVVSIEIAPITNNGIGLKQKFHVRHDTPAAARNWLLENAVEARVASQDDIVAMVKAGIEPVGPYEEVAGPAPVQTDLVNGGNDTERDE